MIEIIHNDIEMLNRKKKNILELQKEIEELNKIEKLKQLQQEEIKLKNKINKFSTYDSMQIGNIIAKLMTIFEGTEYHCSKNDIFFLDCDYCVEPILSNRDNTYNYPKYKINNIKQQRCLCDSDDKREMCCLLPSNFESNNSQNKDIEYIQLFIDYLYERRSSKLLEDICETELEEILQEFLEITNDLQQKRRAEIKQKIQEKIKQQQREEFEKSCIIDRKLIYNSLSYLINHYESDMVAKKEIYEDRSYKGLYGYHKLILEYDGKQVIYNTIIDEISWYPDEEYCYRGIHINPDKNTNVPFFDIKSNLLPIINNSVYVKKFMLMIENYYNEGKTITSEDIQEFLIIISNENKTKKRVLRRFS